MNKQYLKSLQDRAQKLLQISSDEGSQQQIFQLSKTKSRRVDLKEVLQGADLNEMKTQFEDYRNTDVELLKKCINMTNENSQLKKQLKSYQTQISQLKTQNVLLQKEVQNYKSQMIKKKDKQSTRSNNNDSPYNKLNQHDYYSFISNSNKSPKNEQLRQKSLSSYNMASLKSTIMEEQSRRYLEQINRIQERHKREVCELQQRLKISQQKFLQMEQILVKEREKSRKLFKFINQEIPQLKDIVTKLTNKVDTQVESLLLKDINQNQFQINGNKHRQQYQRKHY